MKNIFLTILVSFGLVACGTIRTKGEVKPSVVVEYKYVSAPIPEEFLDIPANIQPINLEKATQKEVADWLARSEGRALDIENKLKAIKKTQNQNKELK